MEKSQRLRLGEVRAALRLVGECRDLGYDPAQWTVRAFEGLCKLVGARAGNGGDVRLTRPNGPLKGLTYFDAGLEPGEHDLYATFLRTHGIERHPIAGAAGAWRTATPRPGRLMVLSRRQLVPDGEWYGSDAYNECHRVIGIDHCLVSALERTADECFSTILLHRARDEADFAPRQRQLLYLFHEELGRLIGPVLVSADDRFSPTQLPPRVQETLRCLLEGDGEKQAAARMGLSRETVHQYVKALYRHYQVASRAELLARVLRRTNPGG